MGGIAVLTVGELLERGELEVTAVAGKTGLSRAITVPRIQKPGLALTGWPEQLHPHRVLVLGGTEIDYLVDHPPARVIGIETLMGSDPACVVVCRGQEPPAELRAALSTQIRCGDALVEADLERPTSSPGTSPPFCWRAEFAEVFRGERPGLNAPGPLRRGIARDGFPHNMELTPVGDGGIVNQPCG